MKNQRKRKHLLCAVSSALAVLLSLSTASTTLVTAQVENVAENQNQTTAPNAQLRSLIFDRAYKLEPVGNTDGKEFDVSGFNSSHFEYKATVYDSWNSVKIYPFKFASSNASVTVNGNAITNENSFYELNVENKGTYQVNVKVTENGVTNTYNIQVEKVDTDYRGRKPVVDNENILNKMKVVSMTASTGTPNSSKDKLLEVLKKKEIMPVNTGAGDTGTFWKPSNSANPYFIIDLGDVYDVSRIRGVVFPRNKYVKATISVSADNVDWTASDNAKESEGITFKTVIDKGDSTNNTDWHQDVLRYDFNEVQKVRYIKWEVNGTVDNIQVHQFMVYQDLLQAPTSYDPPENGDVAWQHEERHKYLSSGQATVIERGFPILGWMPSEGYGRDIPRPNESEEFGWDGPLFYDAPTANMSYLKYNPNSYWGLSKAPGGQNGMPDVDPPGTADRPLLPDSLLPYVHNAVSFCFGDEQNYSTDEVAKLKKWFDYTREKYPSVILHTNNRASDSWAYEENLSYYTKTAQPDLLTWDDYYNNENGDKDGGGAGTCNIQNPDYHGSAIQTIFAKSQKWEPFRKYAMNGIDGSGNKPILYGQYLDSFQTNQPESIKNLVANLSVLSGQKWLNFFRVEFQYDKSFTWDEDGTPTTGLWEWSQITHDIHAMDEWTNRLNNDWILLEKGTGNNILNQNKYRLTSFVRENDNVDASNEGLQKQKEYGIKDINVTVDTTRVQRDVKGDVAIGLAKTLPGLYQDEIAEWFKGATAPKAFMVLNGLVDGSTGDDETIRDDKNQRYESSCFKPYVVEREKGSAANTRQEIKITVQDNFKDTPLYHINPEKLDAQGNATVEKVELKEENGNKYFTVDLGGGEMGVYFWGTNTTSNASTQDTNGKQASFAFDNYFDTYWEAKEKSEFYTIENSFDAQRLESIKINEKGENITNYEIYYKTINNNQWQKLQPNEVSLDNFTTIGKEVVLNLNSPKSNVTGVQIKITGTKENTLPAIHEIVVEGQKENLGLISVNDNDLGSSLYRFEYDGKWFYREVEDDKPSRVYPRGGEGHVGANYANAEAKFRFWGYQVTLDLRQDKVASEKDKLEIKLYDKDGNEVEATPQWNDSEGTVTFTTKDKTDGAYMLYIRTKEEGVDLGIDGADVKYNNLSTEKITFTGKSAPTQSPYQFYLNDKDRDNTKTDYFSFYNSGGATGQPADLTTFTRGENEFYDGSSSLNNHQVAEEKGWVSYIGRNEDENGGGVRTQKGNDPCYSVTFNGTSLSLYAGLYPFQQPDTSKDQKTKYGNFTVYLDGEELQLNKKSSSGATLTVTNDNDTNWKWAGGSAIQMLKIDTGSKQNQKHTVVVVNDGINRVDYAVVGKEEEPAVDPTNEYRSILLTQTQGGTLSTNVAQAREGETVVVTAHPNAGYQLQENSIKAIAENGSQLNITKKSENNFEFQMANSNVDLSATFIPLSNNNTNAGGTETPTVNNPNNILSNAIANTSDNGNTLLSSLIFAISTISMGILCVFKKLKTR